MIYVLLFLIVLFFIVCYLLKKDIFHPSCLICLTFGLSVFCAILNIERWGIALSLKTVGIILIGIISFVLPSLLVNDKKRINDGIIQKSESIYYSRITIFLFLCIQSVLLLLHISWVLSCLGGFSASNFVDVMKQFRFALSFDQEIEMPEYISQGIKFNRAFIYVYSFLFIHNLFLDKAKSKRVHIDVMYIISLLMFSVQTFISGGRSELVLLMINIFVEIFFVYNFYKNKNGTEIGGNILKITFGLVLVLYLFSVSRTLVGRSSTENFLDYVTKYFGGSIQLFDLYIKSPIPPSSIWGKETFFAINKFLYQIGVIKEESYTLHLEYRQSNGVELGNIYTAFRRMYQDFGVFGVVILNSVHGLIMTLYYRSLKRMKFINQLNIKTLLYFMIVHSIVLMPFSDFFFSTIFSINYVNILVYMVFILTVLKNINITLKR